VIAAWAIVKLTMRAALRSRMWLLLGGILCLTVVLLPMTVSGDGTALSYIQVALRYSLATTGFILALSTLWLSCFALAGDLETHQLHLVAVKPVARATIWLGKCAGVLLVNGVLLSVAALAIYGLVHWQLRQRAFLPEEKERLEREVLVGRRVYLPETPDVEQLIENEFQRRVAEGALYQSSNPHIQAGVLRDQVRKVILSRLGEVACGDRRFWHYTGVRAQDREPVFLRYRTYLGSYDNRDQRKTVGHWAARLQVPADPDRPDGPRQEIFVPVTPAPEEILGGAFQEIPLHPAVVSEEGEAMIGFINLDPRRANLFFQVADGPKLLVRETGFWQNYLRAVVLLAIKLVFLAGLGCAAGGVFSAPVAMFASLGYLAIGIFSAIVIKFDPPDPAKWNTAEGFNDLVGRAVSQAALVVVSPVHQLEAAGSLANGELIEAADMVRLGARFLLLRGLPLVLVGIWYYRRRELGLVQRR